MSEQEQQAQHRHRAQAGGVAPDRCGRLASGGPTSATVCSVYEVSALAARHSVLRGDRVRAEGDPASRRAAAAAPSPLGEGRCQRRRPPRAPRPRLTPPVARRGTRPRHPRFTPGPGEGSRSRRSRTTSRTASRSTGSSPRRRSRSPRRPRTCSGSSRPARRCTSRRARARRGRHRRGIRRRRGRARTWSPAGSTGTASSCGSRSSCGRSTDGRRRRSSREAQRKGAVAARTTRSSARRSAEAWTKAGIVVDAARGRAAARPLANDVYPVFMMGRGLGNYSGALAAMSRCSAPGSGGSVGRQARTRSRGRRARSRARGVPRSEAASRRSGSSASSTWRRRAGRSEADREGARGKFTYAADLAPDDIAVAARGGVRVARGRQARGRARPVPEARHAASVGSRGALSARRRAVAHRRGRRPPRSSSSRSPRSSPDHLPARRVLVLDPRLAQRHASSSSPSSRRSRSARPTTSK